MRAQFADKAVKLLLCFGSCSILISWVAAENSYLLPSVHWYKKAGADHQQLVSGLLVHAFRIRGSVEQRNKPPCFEISS